MVFAFEFLFKGHYCQQFLTETLTQDPRWSIWGHVCKSVLGHD